MALDLVHDRTYGACQVNSPKGLQSVVLTDRGIQVYVKAENCDEICDFLLRPDTVEQLSKIQEMLVVPGRSKSKLDAWEYPKEPFLAIRPDGLLDQCLNALANAESTSTSDGSPLVNQIHDDPALDRTVSALQTLLQSELTPVSSRVTLLED